MLKDANAQEPRLYEQIGRDEKGGERGMTHLQRPPVCQTVRCLLEFVNSAGMRPIHSPVGVRTSVRIARNSRGVSTYPSRLSCFKALISRGVTL